MCLAVLGLHCCVGFSLVVECRGYSLVVHRLLIAVASLIAENSSRHVSFSSFGTQALVAPWHVGSSQSKDQTRVAGIGRQVLNHWTSRKSHSLLLMPFLQGLPGHDTPGSFIWSPLVPLQSPDF